MLMLTTWDLLTIQTSATASRAGYAGKDFIVAETRVGTNYTGSHTLSLADILQGETIDNNLQINRITVDNIGISVSQLDVSVMVKNLPFSCNVSVGEVASKNQKALTDFANALLTKCAKEGSATLSQSVSRLDWNINLGDVVVRTSVDH